MKLELKHLAGYLPYGLKAQDLRTKEVRAVTLLHFTYDNETVGHNHLIYDGLMLSKHLPILRPLSDLTKEIEVNGDKFVPIDWFEHDSVSDYFDGNIWVKFLFEDGKCGDLDFIPYGMIQKLLEWHFDIYGLIDAGLAIDINTL
jgi:hypothetical protein